MTKSELFGKTAIILGACGGIGREIVNLFDEYEMKLVISDLKRESLKEMEDRLDSQTLSFPCDITDKHQVKSLFNAAIELFETIDILVNCVGIIHPALFENTTYQEIRQQIDINLMGTINLIKEVLPIMKKARKGNIVIISSLASIVPETYSSIYTATKFALRGLDLTLNLELKEYDITVSTIFPDSVDTPMLAFEAEHGGSPLTFLNDPIPPIKVAKAVEKAILKKKAEVCVPSSQGRLAKFIMCFPKIVQWLWPKFEEKGEKKKQEYLKNLKEKNQD
ncbi:MAG: SDR family NAD(P)-dependent oxidoreductase [Promethearchaeia archaeon]